MRYGPVIEPGQQLRNALVNAVEAAFFVGTEAQVGPYIVRPQRRASDGVVGVEVVNFVKPPDGPHEVRFTGNVVDTTKWLTDRLIVTKAYKNATEPAAVELADVFTGVGFNHSSVVRSTEADHLRHTALLSE